MYFDTAYAPFGETYASAGTLDPSYTGQMNDTGHRQDTAGGLYDFLVREYSTQGRWPNPDPLGKGATSPNDPQTQNRYAYVRNNPMSYTDPTGMKAFGFQGEDEGGCDPADPLCNLSFWDASLRYAFGRGGDDGCGGERPRPVPWQQLPLGLFAGVPKVGISLHHSNFSLVFENAFSCNYTIDCPNGNSNNWCGITELDLSNDEGLCFKYARDHTIGYTDGSGGKHCFPLGLASQLYCSPLI